AKAFTGRNKIVKMEGGYHGTHEAVEISITPSPAEAGPPETPSGVAASTGLFRGVAADVGVAPFNDMASTQRIIEPNAGYLAAGVGGVGVAPLNDGAPRGGFRGGTAGAGGGVMAGPVFGSKGVTPATAGFLRGLRESTKDCGALLILDEIITLRLAYGGAQEI